MSTGLIKRKNEEKKPIAGIYRVIYKYLINGINAQVQSHSVFAVFAVLGGSANKLLRDSAVKKTWIIIQKKLEKKMRG